MKRDYKSEWIGLLWLFLLSVGVVVTIDVFDYPYWVTVPALTMAIFGTMALALVAVAVIIMSPPFLFLMAYGWYLDKKHRSQTRSVTVLK